MESPLILDPEIGKMQLPSMKWNNSYNCTMKEITAEKIYLVMVLLSTARVNNTPIGHRRMKSIPKTRQ